MVFRGPTLVIANRAFLYCYNYQYETARISAVEYIVLMTGISSTVQFRAINCSTMEKEKIIHTCCFSLQIQDMGEDEI